MKSFKTAASRITILLIALAMILASTPMALGEGDYPAFDGGVAEIQKYGNLILTIDPALLAQGGYEYGDVIRVVVNDVEYLMPLGTNYSDVDAGKMVARDNGGVLTVAINMGDFATNAGLATKITGDDGAYTWEFPEGSGIEDIRVSLGMAEKAGYYDEYLIHQLTRTNERADYASDEEFANVRVIQTGALGQGALIRSSSPVNDELGRAAYADAFIAAHGVKTVVNLADNDEAIDGYIAAEGFASPYYRSLYEAGGVKALNMGVDYAAADYQKSLADGLRFVIAGEGPYLVHCTEGKDRAGFVSALLACFMGASYDEVVADYMQTYVNYYHIAEGSEQYQAVMNSNIVPILMNITSAVDAAQLAALDMKASAEAYLDQIGLTKEEQAALYAKLSADHNP